MARSRPALPGLESLRKRAKRLLRDRPGDFSGLREAQLALAREHGFASWLELRDAVEAVRLGGLPPARLAGEFADLACLTYTELENPRRVQRAIRLLEAQPELVETSVHAAAAAGDVGALRRQLDADPAAASSRGGPRDWPPLLYLAFSRVPDAPPARDALACARLLLERGADPNAHFELHGTRNTALTGAIGEGEQGLEAQPPHAHARALALLLLDAGAEPNDSQGLYNSHFTPGNAWLELLLERGLTSADMVNWSGPWRMRMLDYLLCTAVSRGFAERVDLLLRNGADPRAIDPYSQRSAYRNALREGRDGIAAQLVAAGAPSEELAPEDLAHVACARGDEPAVRRLCAAHPELVANPRLLCGAAARGDVALMAALLELGADPRAGVPESPTPLHVAARGGHLDAVELLLAHGADVAARDEVYDGTPIGWAHVFGRTEVRDHLLDRTRDVFDLAAFARAEQLEAVLRADPTRAHSRRGRGRTPLHGLTLAGPRGAAALDLLLGAGADLDARTDDGRTPLDVAVAVENDEVADLLRERGAQRG